MTYTPDTEDVRSCYEGEVFDWGERGKEFDRWIAAHDAELREQIAAEIDMEAADWADVAQWALRVAARIARGL